MMVVNCDEHFKKVKEFADATRQLAEFEERIAYLSNYAEGGASDVETRCQLRADWAPYSFYFDMEVRKKGTTDDFKRWFNGGLIYHGRHDNGGDGSSPTFSVNLTPVSGWAIHT